MAWRGSPKIARVRGKPRSLIRQGKRPAAADLVRRKFTAVAPDVLWCADVTQIDTGEGRLYLFGHGGGPVFSPAARLRHVRTPRRGADQCLAAGGGGHFEVAMWTG